MTCARCPEPSVVNLDGEPLCQSCATVWVRGEGRALMEEDARHNAMLDANEGDAR